MNPRFPTGALALTACAVLPQAHAQDTGVSTLAPVVVQAGSARGSLTVPDVAQAERDLARIPGNVSLVDSEAYRDGAVMSLRDALAQVPGVYVQNPAGQETTKLSIRGSGLSNPIGMRGVRLLRDGLPLSRADDTSDTAYADPFTADYIEIYRGGNALQYGAATLGGAINLVSPTGYSREGVRLRVEGGSDGYLRGQAQAGQVFGNGLDAFVSVSRFHTDGSREHAGQDITRFYGNLGYRFSATSEGRLHLDVERQRQDMPGALLLSQLQADPGSVNTGATWTGRSLDVGPRNNIAYQHKWLLGGNDSFSAGVYRTATRFEVLGGPSRLVYDAVDYGIAIRHALERELGGRAAGFTWGLNYADGYSDNASYGPIAFGPVMIAPGVLQYEDIRGDRSTVELFGEARYALTPRLALVGGAQLVRAWRSNTIDLVRPSPVLPIPPFSPLFRPEAFDARYTGFSPKLGVLWQASAQAQVYANLNRSYEPPNTVEFANATGVLGAQRATTLEIGTRGGRAALRWDVALYRSKVTDELLSVEWPLGSNRYTSGNIPRTTHTGVEAGLGGQWRPHDLPGRFDWSLAYTWNHFRIDGDGGFGGNALPGIPTHYARMELLFRHDSGVYLGPNVELASGWYADQANTLEAPGYGIVNFRLGYAAPNGRWLLFLDARHLADRHYAATTDWLVDARGMDAAVFNPGLGRALFAGVQMQW